MVQRVRDGMKEILALNCGSSSLKYAVFAGHDRVLRGEIAKIGAGGVADHAHAVHAVFDALATAGIDDLRAVGHRVVHGGPDHAAPLLVDDAVLASLEEAIPFAPLHLPVELATIRAVSQRFAGLRQVVCFDTAFHRTLPEVARRFALPSALFDGGVRRYGFHGLSYEYVVESLGARLLGRAVIAHLGSGASMVATLEGRSVDTTMGFTPSAGLVMGTRSGDVDPGLIVYLLEHRGYDASSLDRLVNREAGLLALSGTTSDMAKLLAARASDPRARLAVDVFCYQARKWVGALAATLDGIDTLVFTGGIGEHSPEVRLEICRSLRHLGIFMDEARNHASEAIVSAEGSACRVRVVTTDEERMIARHTTDVLAAESKR